MRGRLSGKMVAAAPPLSWDVCMLLFHNDGVMNICRGRFEPFDVVQDQNLPRVPGRCASEISILSRLQCNRQSQRSRGPDCNGPGGG